MVEIQRTIDRVFPPMAEGRYPYWRLVPRGWSQLCFHSNEVTGLLLLAAAVVASPIAGAYLLVSGLVAPAARRLLGASDETLATGLPGLNPSLVALALPALYATSITDVGMWLVLLVCVLAAVVLTHLLVRFVPVPTLAVPFVLTFWTLDALSGHLSVLRPVDGSTGSVDVFHPVTALLDSLGAALFSPTAVSGVLFALGVLVASRRLCVVAVSGAAVGVYVSYYYGSADAAAVDLGLYGSNGVLAAMAVFAIGGERLRLAILGAVLATVLLPALQHLTEETLAAPFVLATWAVLGLGWVERRWFAHLS